MTQEITAQALFTEYLGHFDSLIGDKRTSKTFGEIVRGSIHAGSLVCQRIAAHYQQPISTQRSCLRSLPPTLCTGGA